MPQCDECRQEEGYNKFVSDSDIYCDTCFNLTKECRGCHSVLNISKFEKNQRAPSSGIRSRRSECKECRKNRKSIPPKARREYEKKSPKPQIGDTFECPLCERMFTVNKTNVNLDHDSTTGEIRGYICADCNTGMGKMRDDISVLARAILWLKRSLNSWFF